MTKELGFTAYYRRRLPTAMEKINDTCFEAFVEFMVKDLYRASVAYLYFKGTEPLIPVYHYWGAGDTV